MHFFEGIESIFSILDSQSLAQSLSLELYYLFLQ